MPRQADAVPALAASLIVALLGFDQGGYAPASWVWSAALLVATAVALFVGRPVQPSRLELAFLAALSCLLAWTLLSGVWSLDPTASLLEAQRLLLYLATAAALVLLAGVSSRRPLLAGALLAVAVLCLAGLADVLVGDDPIGPLSADPGSPLRLAEPLGYANAVALLAAMGVLLALGLGAGADVAVLRAACLALPPPLLATLYFTYGRGAWLALAVGLTTALAVGPSRRTLGVGALACAPPALAAVLAAASVDGHAARAAAIVLCAAASASVGAVLPLLERRVDRRFALALAAAGLVSAGVVIGATGGPVELVRDGYRSFTTPTHAGAGPARLLTFSGSSRVDYWRVAAHDVEDYPVLGSGAGSYRRYWYSRRPAPQPARDAHSLYLETLAELGPLGLALLLAAVGTPLLAGVRARDAVTPAALGPYAAYVAHAGQDWDWEMPAVTVTAIVCAVALLLSARPREAPLPWPPRVVGGAVAVTLAALSLLAYAGNRKLAIAESGSAQAARRAADLQPWSAEPWRLLGETQLARGEVGAARRSFRAGLERDDGDWELWLDLALASDGAERGRALRRATALNPREPDLAELAGG
jgi:O-Antigen ligase